jgi:hypothetical protein
MLPAAGGAVVIQVNDTRPEMDDPSGDWYEPPNIRGPDHGLMKAGKQIHKET